MIAEFGMLCLAAGVALAAVRERLFTHLRQALDQGDTVTGLAEATRLLRHPLLAGRQNELWVSMATLHTWSGDLPAARADMEHVVPTLLRGAQRIACARQRLELLILLDEGHEADWVVHHDFNHPIRSMPVQGTLAAYHLWRGDRARGRHDLEALLAQPGAPIVQAGYHYHLGRDALRQGRDDDARRHFEEAARLAPGTWFAEQGPALLQAPRIREF